MSEQGLKTATNELHKLVDSFHNYWIEQSEAGENYPLSMTSEDWFEEFMAYINLDEVQDELHRQSSAENSAP